MNNQLELQQQRGETPFFLVEGHRPEKFHIKLLKKDSSINLIPRILSLPFP